MAQKPKYKQLLDTFENEGKSHPSYDKKLKFYKNAGVADRTEEGMHYRMLVNDIAYVERTSKKKSSEKPKAMLNLKAEKSAQKVQEFPTPETEISESESEKEIVS